jgi:hypothetical protein
MEAGIRPRLTAAKGRSFGLTVGGVFVAIAAVLWWRGHLRTCAVLGTLGTLLILGGLLVPTRMGPVERAWMGLAVLISKVTNPLVMGIIYFVVMLPVGLLRRAFGGNPMVHRESGGTYWKTRPEGARRTGSLKRQF